METLQYYSSADNIEFIANEVKKYLEEFANQDLSKFFNRATCHLLVAKFLIEKVGLGVNMQDRFGNSLLSCTYIGKKNRTDVMDYLISNGANVDVQNCEGETPLMILLRNPILTIAQYRHRQLLLKNGASITLKNNRGFSALDLDPKIKNRYERLEEMKMSLFDIGRSVKLPTVDLTKLREK